MHYVSNSDYKHSTTVPTFAYTDMLCFIISSCDLCVIYYTSYKITEKQAFVISNQSFDLIDQLIYKKNQQNVLFKKRDTIDLIKKMELFSRRNVIELFSCLKVKW